MILEQKKCYEGTVAGQLGKLNTDYQIIVFDPFEFPRLITVRQFPKIMSCTDGL